jgi:hypothetical protein
MVVKKDGVRDEIRRRRADVAAYRNRFPTVENLLVDHYPQEWERVRDCRWNYRVWESVERPGHYKVTPYACWDVPYCVVCTRTTNHQRARAALDRFARATPAGKEPAFVHAVLTAPASPNGEGWGWKASQNVPTFALVIRKALEDVYGPGLGGVMSYQDFGERAFAKRHPHMDLSLNGWLIEDASVKPLPRVRLERGGYDRVAAATARRAKAIHVDAGPSNVDFSARIVGVREYYKVLRYQMREMVDFRKAVYSRTKQAVEWLSYKDARRERFTVQEFKAGYLEYRHRLGLEGGSRVEFHRSFGHLSKRSLPKVEALVGGAPLPHGRKCPCSECGDWERRFDEEFDAYDRDPEDP